MPPILGRGQILDLSIVLGPALVRGGSHLQFARGRHVVEVEGGPDCVEDILHGGNKETIRLQQWGLWGAKLLRCARVRTRGLIKTVSRSLEEEAVPKCNTMPES